MLVVCFKYSRTFILPFSIMVANIIRNVTIFEDYLLRLVRYLTRDKNVKRHVSLQTDPGNTA